MNIQSKVTESRINIVLVIIFIFIHAVVILLCHIFFHNGNGGDGGLCHRP